MCDQPLELLAAEVFYHHLELATLLQLAVLLGLQLTHEEVFSVFADKEPLFAGQLRDDLRVVEHGRHSFVFFAMLDPRAVEVVFVLLVLSVDQLVGVQIDESLKAIVAADDKLGAELIDTDTPNLELAVIENSLGFLQVVRVEKQNLVLLSEHADFVCPTTNVAHFRHLERE